MRFAVLGGSGIKVSRLGGNIFGKFCGAEETASLLAYAEHSGVNFIDTSDTYSAGDSERLIGRAIKAKRSRWVVATKAGVDNYGSRAGTASESIIRHKVEGSLRRLRTDYIDLYQTHHFDPVTPLAETIGALVLLRQQGKILSAGISNFTSDQLRHLLSAAEDCKPDPIASVQAHFNVLRPDPTRPLLRICNEQNIAVLAYGVLARGILSGKYIGRTSLPARARAAESESIRNELTDDVLSTVERLKRLANDFRMTISQLAIAWALAQQPVTAVIIGVRSITQLDDDKSATDASLTHEQLEAIVEVVGPTARFGHLSLGSQI
jgi:1-deoxyxylulose-5-phosphate synthase